MMGKLILPWFGGGASTWTTCILFFQFSLLAGYLYAHCVTMCLRPTLQAAVHIALLGASLFLLPNPTAWKPEPGGNPVCGILLVLAANVGAPFFLLSATGPLLQAWLARPLVSRFSYRLYALSNVASLLALLAYPTVVEPTLRTSVQLILWSACYAAFAIACGYCAVRFAAVASSEERSRSESRKDDLPVDSESIVTSEPIHQAAPQYTLHTAILWLALSACGSAMLLATTNQLCQEIAVVPLLWIIPLILYLLSFIICFDNPGWYKRSVFAVFMVNMMAWAAVCICLTDSISLTVQMIVYLLALFACCMACHGELVRSKPDARHLTAFYVTVALGGVVGSAGVGVLAPVILPRYWEYQITLASCYLLMLSVWLRDGFTPLHTVVRPSIAWGCLIGGQVALAGAYPIKCIASAVTTESLSQVAISMVRCAFDGR